MRVGSGRCARASGSAVRDAGAVIGRCWMLSCDADRSTWWTEVRVGQAWNVVRSVWPSAQARHVLPAVLKRTAPRFSTR